MQLVAAGTRHDVYGATCGYSSREIKIDRGNLEFLYNLLRETHRRPAVPDLHYTSAVNRHSRGAPVISHWGTQQRDKSTIITGSRGVLRARVYVCQLQKVPAIQREAFGLRPRDHARDLIGVIAKLGRGGADGHCFGGRADMRGEIHGYRGASLK